MTEPRRRRAVTFHSETRLYLVQSRSEIEQQRPEHDLPWYTRDELARFQSDIRRTVRRMRRRERRRDASLPSNDDGNEDDLHCDEDSAAAPRCEERGLEHLRSAAHVEQVRINRDCCTLAVLSQQRRQREAGLDPSLDECREGIAAASRTYSEWGRERAQRAGMRDAAVARRVRRREEEEGERSGEAPPPHASGAAEPSSRRRATHPPLLTGRGQVPALPNRGKANVRSSRVRMHLLGMGAYNRNASMA